MSAPWTDAHQREALRRTYELAAELSAASPFEALALVTEDWQPGALGAGPAVRSAEEAPWRTGLAERGGLDPARIDREVARVRALAEGRLVRDTRVEMRSACAECDGTGHVDEEDDCSACEQAIPVTCPVCKGAKTRRVRVTRIRRAP